MWDGLMLAAVAGLIMGVVVFIVAGPEGLGDHGHDDH